MVVISNKAQFKIQQMAFMLIAVFIFFMLVALFFLQISLGGLRFSAEQLEREQVMNALLSWSELPEFSCSDRSSNCIDEDKIFVLGGSDYNLLYRDFWPVASIRVYRLNTNNTELVLCPQQNCNYYEVYNSGQASRLEYSNYVSICKTGRIENQVLRVCEIGKISVGVREIPN